jgi:hypothetical protein
MPPPDHDPKLWAEVPSALQPGLMAYFDEHRPTGGFLQAMLENDLRTAVARADVMNATDKNLQAIVRYLHMCAPAGSWGDPEKVKYWLNKCQLCNEWRNGQTYCRDCIQAGKRKRIEI